MGSNESRVAVLVDCDNTTPAILDYTLRVMAQFGRVVVRRGYGNSMTLSNKWQEALVRMAFTPHLQYQYVSHKNTSDIALALDALEAHFDDRADHFCIVTSDSDFAYLCRKLHERGAMVSVVGEARTPSALRNASDHFFEWSPDEQESQTNPDAGKLQLAPTRVEHPAKQPNKRRPKFIIQAVELLTGGISDGKVALASLGQYLKRTDPEFSPAAYGHSGLLDMLKTYDLLTLKKEEGGHYTVKLRDASLDAVEEPKRELA